MRIAMRCMLTCGWIDREQVGRVRYVYLIPFVQAEVEPCLGTEDEVV
jgi:hypothetical protein